MDPLSAALLAPWQQLGVFGSIVGALSTVVVFQWLHIKAQAKAHLEDVKVYADKYAGIILENAKTQTALANAIERLGDKLK